MNNMFYRYFWSILFFSQMSIAQINQCADIFSDLNLNQIKTDFYDYGPFLKSHQAQITKAQISENLLKNIRVLKAANGGQYLQIEVKDSYKNNKSPDTLELSRSEIEKNKLKFDQEQGFYTEQFGHITEGDYIYVMDQYGDFFVLPINAVFIWKKDIHHVSLTQGLPVSGAGEIKFKSGYISHVDDFSGHYSPNILIFFQTIESLMNKNALTNLTQIKVNSPYLSRDKDLFDRLTEETQLSLEKKASDL